MAQSGDVWEELLAIKGEIANTLNVKADEARTASRAHAEAFAEQMKDLLHELGETLQEEEQRLEAMVAAQPIPALAAAFALGLLVGISTRALR